MFDLIAAMNPALDIAWSQWLWQPINDGWRPLFTILCPQWDSYSLLHSWPSTNTMLTYCTYRLTNKYAHTSPHHCSIIRSNTRLTFRSESRLKSVSTKGAVGGVSGRRPDVSVSSQSAASNCVGARRFRDFPVDDRGEVQMGGGGGAGITWLGVITAGDGGSSSKREEQRGEGRKLSSLVCCWSAWGGGEGPGAEWARDLWSETLMEPGGKVVKMMRHWKK